MGTVLTLHRMSETAAGVIPDASMAPSAAMECVPILHTMTKIVVPVGTAVPMGRSAAEGNVSGTRATITLIAVGAAESDARRMRGAVFRVSVGFWMKTNLIAVNAGTNVEKGGIAVEAIA